MVKFLDDFSSPPHIHNISYRGVVIEGNVHNDDPNATAMWMPSGSYWTQPKGEVHITAAKGKENLAFIEIDQGPYLVLPMQKAFDSGERPLNMDRSNIMWFNASNDTNNQSKIAYLWGSMEEGKLNGTLLKLPSNFKGSIMPSGSLFQGVVISGEIDYKLNADANKALEAGSLFSSKVEHNISTTKETLLYIRSDGKFETLLSK